MGNDMENIKQFDIVYVLGKGSSNNNAELRYSLRSVEKFAIGLKNIFIVGIKPEFISDKIIFIPADDIYPSDLANKDRNQWYKLEIASNDPRLNEYFLFGSDDFILTKPSKWEDFIPRQTGIVTDQYLQQIPSNEWTKTRIATLKRFNYQTYLWHPHIFSQMSKSKFQYIAAAADYKNRNDVIVHTFYYNFIKAKPIQDFDTKEYHIPEEYKPGYRHISHWDYAFNYKPFYEKIHDMFPFKSKYEINNDIKNPMHKYDFSIIVPCFNSQKYLSEALDSILKNKFNGKYEVICVNDGSIDNTQNILNEYKLKIPNMKIISYLKNQGLSYARNIALENANGQYAIFLDSDDKLRNDYMKIVYDQMNKYNLDILYIYGKSFFSTTQAEQKYSRYKKYYHTKPKFPKVMTGLESLKFTYDHNDNTFSACLNVINIDFIRKNNLKYINGILYEDTPFNIEAAIKAHRVFNITDQIYLRRVHEESIVIQQKSFKHFAGYVVGAYEMIKIINKYVSDKQMRNLIKSHTSNIYMKFAKQLFANKDKNKILNDMVNFTGYADVLNKFNQMLINKEL